MPALHGGPRPARPPPFDLYIFDLDGTLVDSRSDLARCVNRARADLGLAALPEEEIYGYIGEGVARLMERALPPERRSRLDEATARFREHYARHLLDTTRVYDGVPDLLEALASRGAWLAVATNKPEVFSRAILEGLGIAHRFSLVVGGDTLPERKPSALPVRHILAAARAPVDRTLLVGDSAVDVETARNAGVAVCAVSWGLGGKEALASLRPDFLADRPSDVLAAGAAS